MFASEKGKRATSPSRVKIGKPDSRGATANVIERRSWDRSLVSSPDMEEEAETTLVAVLEERENSRRVAFGKEDSARAVLGAVPPEAADIFDQRSKSAGVLGVSDISSPNAADRPKLSDLAWRVRSINRLKKERSSRNLALSGRSLPREDSGEGVEVITDFSSAPPRRAVFRSKTIGPSPFREIVAAPIPHRDAGRNNIDHLFDNVQRVEQMYQIPESESSSVTSTEEEEHPSHGREGEEVHKDTDEEVGAGETTPLQAQLLPRRPQKSSVRSRKKGCSRVSRSLRRRQLAITDVLRPREVLTSTAKFLIYNILALVLPFLVIAAVLFYPLDNPELQFLPSTVRLSWWFIFAARQLITLQLAKCAQYLIVDICSLRSTFAVRVVGPLCTLLLMQSAGWPFVISSWGLWDLIILHGNHRFVRNWLFFLNIRMLSDENSDYGVLESELYLRILLVMVLVGVATSIKRTYLALYLGKRTFVHYKPQLERIMVSMRLLAEVADLAAETETPEFAEVLAQAGDYMSSKPTKKSKWDITFQSSKKDIANDDENSDDEALAEEINEDEVERKEPEEAPAVQGPAPSKPKIEWSQFRSKLDEDGHSRRHEAVHPPLERQKTSATIKIKNLLDRWQEPENKLDEKTSNPSIHDILKFRKALTFIEETHPFSLSFGRADTRDHCIRSAQKVYKRLLNYAPEESILPFDVIGVLAYDEAGNIDEEKTQELVRLFRPDKYDELSLLSFVQSCDWVYKNLRYFRASFANSTLMDKVLEQIFNSIFYFILLLVCMSLLDYDPWRLLVSLSTLVVSFAFAVGPSVAKYVEGILLIAIRRPFDIGDRIKVCSPELVGSPGPGETWIVEDITLTTTTLRYAATNEVSTVNNFSIANSRLVNGARSPRALATVNLLFDIKATHEQIATFLSTVEAFVKDQPRIWSNVVFFRTDQIDPDNGFVSCSLRLQHVKSWQETGAILINQGELLRFCIEVGKKLGITWVSSPTSLAVSLNDKRVKESAVSEKADDGAVQVGVPNTLLSSETTAPE